MKDQPTTITIKVKPTAIVSVSQGEIGWLDSTNTATLDGVAMWCATGHILGLRPTWCGVEIAVIPAGGWGDHCAMAIEYECIDNGPPNAAHAATA